MISFRGGPVAPPLRKGVTTASGRRIPVTSKRPKTTRCTKKLRRSCQGLVLVSERSVPPRAQEAQALRAGVTGSCLNDNANRASRSRALVEAARFRAPRNEIRGVQAALRPCGLRLGSTFRAGRPWACPRLNWEDEGILPSACLSTPPRPHLGAGDELTRTALAASMRR